MFQNQYKPQAWESLRGNWVTVIIATIINGLILGAASSMFYGIPGLVLAGVLGFGLSRLFLSCIRGGEFGLGDLFAGFQINFTNNILTGLLSSLYIFLWSLLFLIPGIIKSYAYAMVFYVLNDNPELSPSEALQESERIMNGHKLEWFLIQLSFIGWILLSVITFGIASLWLTPYMEATKAAFYGDIKN